jgi:F-type H+-transporting ATPase subunit b
MLLPVNNFAAESSSSGLGALGVDPKAFLIQLITFGLAYFVLRRYAFGPIIKTLHERREIIENGVKLGEQMQKEKAAFEAKMAELLQGARREADGIIGSAQETAKENIREAEDKARQKAQLILEEADRRIEQETARVRKQLEKELATLVAEATEAVIEEKVDAKKDAALIERALKESAKA